MPWERSGILAQLLLEAVGCLSGKFPGGMVSRRRDILWQPRSSDLAILDFFFWGYVKHMIWDVPKLNSQKIPKDFEDRFHLENFKSITELESK